MGQVLIPEKLIMELFKHFLLEIPADETYIKDQLSQKLNSMAKRQQYYQSLTEKKKTEP